MEISKTISDAVTNEVTENEKGITILHQNILLARILEELKILNSK